MSRWKGTALCVVLVAGLALSGQAATTRAPSTGTTYVVQPGDTLTSIAGRFGTTPTAIATANNIRNRNLIVIGRKLSIPAAALGSTHAPGVLPAKLQAHPERLALRPYFE